MTTEDALVTAYVTQQKRAHSKATTMTEIPQAALDAGAAALAEDGCRTGATHGIDARTVLEAAAPHIRADERRRVIAEIQASNLGAPLVLNSDATARFLSGPELREQICAFIAEGDNR